MPNVSPRLAAFTLLAFVASAQEPPVRFVAKEPLIRIAVHDLPSLLQTLPQLRLGRLQSEPDVEAALAAGIGTFANKVHRWAESVEALRALQPDAISWDTDLEKQIYMLPWSDVRSFELIASCGSEAQAAIHATVLLEPVPAAEPRLTEVFAAASERAWQAMMGDVAANAAVPQQIDGHPARICRLAAQDGAPPRHVAEGAWFLHLPGQFAGGNGAPEVVGGCQPAPATTPGITLEIDVPRYLRVVTAFTGDTSAMQKALDALGVSDGVLAWRLHPAGEAVQEELSIGIGKANGVLGALLRGMAPLVDQPLPEHGMLQLRCAFDVRELIAAANELMALADLKTLGELGLEEDLVRAWTGGVALAIARPGRGGLVPRLYASFGIVDEEALDRLLARLAAEPWATTKEVEYDGQACVQLRLADVPPAIQPAYCVRDGAIHFAESGLGLRAMLKAAAAGAPRALEVGDVKPPAGKGATVPHCELRFDEVAIHAALHELWLPLLEQIMAPFRGEQQPLLSLADMPGTEVVAPHLTRGRGVLRRQADRLVFAMTGTAGGPELLALLAAFGPGISAQATSPWDWQTMDMQQRVAAEQLTRIHAAIESFRKKNGRRPASLADLLTSGELADGSVLLVPGDDRAEPVLHDGKVLGKSSFRYYRDGIKATPQQEEATVHLVAITPIQWQRAAMGIDGTLYQGFGNFAALTLEQIENKD